MTRVGLSGVTSYWAIRAIVRDPPEDFIARIETGLDEETARRLRIGLEAVQTVVRLQSAAVVTVVLGCVTILLSLFTIRLLGEAGEYLFQAGYLLWLVAGVIFVGSLLAHAVHYREVRHVEAFVEAMRRSSLARDLG